MVGKTGAARVWWQTRCPVIPVAQWGPQELLAPYTKVPRIWPRPVMRVKARTGARPAYQLTPRLSGDHGCDHGRHHQVGGRTSRSGTAAVGLRPARVGLAPYRKPRST